MARRPGDAQTCAIGVGGRDLTYGLRRSSRRTIGFLIDDRGLTVTAPLRTAHADIERALHGKAGWILRKLEEWRLRGAQRQRDSVRWAPGGQVALHGRLLELAGEDPAPAIAPRRPGVRIDAERLLRVGLPAPQDAAGESAWQMLVQRWLQRRARETFAERLAHFAAVHGRAPARWSLTSARTRWGSCNAAGHVRLNWRLVHFPLDVIDYVIAHELAHLTELNHGPRFWATVEAMYPDWRRARAALKASPVATDAD